MLQRLASLVYSVSCEKRDTAITDETMHKTKKIGKDPNLVKIFHYSTGKLFSKLWFPRSFHNVSSMHWPCPTDIVLSQNWKHHLTTATRL